MKMKKLQEIVGPELKTALEASDERSLHDQSVGDVLVSDICDDSRKAVENCLFVAINGSSVDGRKYIDDAIARGAKYVVLEGDGMRVEFQNNALYMYVKNPRVELSHLASKFFCDGKYPQCVAVTGTNGKSSTVDIARQIWEFSGVGAASIGTLGVIYNGQKEAPLGNLTSPGIVELHRIFSRLMNDGVEKIALEASSHGIDQRRQDCVPFGVCAFTNFTQDHLDYHKNLENYWKAKERLFSEVAPEGSIFVVNADDEYSEKINKIAQKRGIMRVGYGYKPGSSVQILNVTALQDRQNVDAMFFGEKISFSLPLCGLFQTYNSLCAATICRLTGVEINDVVQALERLRPICGRLELASSFKGAMIYVDYAHTPDALKNAILSLRRHNPTKIITVFGCGGNRDRQKRYLMGEIAEQFSDVVIVTDDNPRCEDPAIIRKEIMEGCKNATEIGDRKSAIEYAMDCLSAGDALLIAGKGHETYQIIGNDISHFSDKEVVINKGAECK
jgi:UDP-N-acetylmuramoyl-L-alanyl-D-glutamate--2,6-diaminopimelate ligase